MPNLPGQVVVGRGIVQWRIIEGVPYDLDHLLPMLRLSGGLPSAMAIADVVTD